MSINHISFGNSNRHSSHNDWEEEGAEEKPLMAWTVVKNHYDATYEKFPVTKLLGKQFVSDIEAHQILGINGDDGYWGSTTIVNKAAINAEVKRGMEVFNNRRKNTKSTAWRAEHLDYSKFDGHALANAYRDSPHACFYNAFEELGVKFTMKGLALFPPKKKETESKGNQNNLRKDVLYELISKMNAEYHTDTYNDGIKIHSIHIKKNQALLYKMFIKLGYKPKETDTYKGGTKEVKKYLNEWFVDMKTNA